MQVEPADNNIYLHSLNPYLPDMKEMLDVESMYPYLHATDPQCITHQERNQLEPYHNNRTLLVCKLVEKISKKGPKAIEAFIKALARSVEDGVNPGHGDLLEILQGRRRQLSPQVSSISLTTDGTSAKKAPEPKDKPATSTEIPVYTHMVDLN